MAANLASMARPKASPASVMPMPADSRPLAMPHIAKSPADHNASNGVSVEIRKLPSPVAGRVIQMSAAKRPACWP